MLFLVPDKEEFSFILLHFQFYSTSITGQRPSTSETQFSAAAELPAAKETHSWLSLRIEVVRDSMFRDYATEWSDIECT